MLRPLNVNLSAWLAAQFFLRPDSLSRRPPAFIEWTLLGGTRQHQLLLPDLLLTYSAARVELLRATLLDKSRSPPPARLVPNS